MPGAQSVEMHGNAQDCASINDIGSPSAFDDNTKKLASLKEVSMSSVWPSKKTRSSSSNIRMRFFKDSSAGPSPYICNVQSGITSATPANDSINTSNPLPATSLPERSEEHTSEL